MRATITTAAAVLAALALATPAAAAEHGDTGTHEVGHYLGAIATFGGDAGVRGIVELTAPPGRPTRARGILVGLLLPAAQAPRLALSDQACGSADAAYVPVGGPLEVRPDGTALLEHEGIFYAQALRRAVSLALLDGDPDRPIIIGCVPLRKFAADPSPDARDDVLLSAGRLGGGEQVLGNLLAAPAAPATGAAVLAGLQPGEEYGLALSDRSCAEATAADAVPLGSAVADAAGTAFASLEMHPGTSLSLRDARALLVTRPFSDGLVITVCADPRTIGVRLLR